MKTLVSHLKGSTLKEAPQALMRAAEKASKLVRRWSCVIMEHRVSGVIASAPWYVRPVNLLPGFRPSITCNDGTSGILEMSALMNSPNAGIYAELKDAQLFQQVNIELGALTWPNEADLDPAWVREEIGENKTWAVSV